MSELEFKQVLSQVQRDAEIADKRLASFIVTLWCWLGAFGVMLLVVWVLL